MKTAKGLTLNFVLILLMTHSTHSDSLQPSVVKLEKTIFATDQRLFWSGRTLIDGRAQTMDWPGVMVQFIYCGEPFKGVFKGRSHWEVWVNGRFHKTFEVESNLTEVLLLDSALAEDSKIQLIKASENQSETVSLVELILPEKGDLKPLSDQPLHRVEFIGDSYTVGFGNMSATREPVPGQEDSTVFATTNAARSFAHILARRLNLDIQLNAFSGRGLVKNYMGMDPGKEYPYFYNQALISPRNNEGKNILWDFESWQPEVVVIALGTNDFQGEGNHLKPALFIEAYQKFIDRLRGLYPGVRFVVVANPIWPNDLLIPTLREVLKSQEAQGHNDLYYFEYFPQRTGLYWHPDLLDHEKTAAKLEPLIRKLLSDFPQK